MADPQTSLAQNLMVVQSRIAAAAQRSGRRADEITLVAVSKTVDPIRMLAALDLGVTILGENRVQEAHDKWALIADKLKQVNGEFHLVGHLQTNKAKEAVRLFDLIQSLDSERLAREIDRYAAELGKVQRVLVEVNTSGELTKFGVESREALNLMTIIQTLKNLRLEGLMTIGPLTGGRDATRRSFQQLRELHERAGGVAVLPHRSMGMTQDFEAAIAEGATMVRIGTAIFGDQN